jgi:soluble lytic murein transglycosylase-like protein
MKTLSPALFLLVLSFPVFGQNYSLDNFDIKNGVQVQAPPALPPTRVPFKTNRSKRNALKPTASTAQVQPATESLAPLVKTTFATTSVLNSTGTPLRGYTTGNSEIDGLLIQSGTKNGLDPLLLYSVMHQESSFKPRAISHKGASGLMQLMPGTARRYGVTNIFDPKQNIEGGARYLRFLLTHFEGNLNLALAGYNAGEGAVEKYGWRIPPYAETQEYVRRISRRYALLRDPNAPLYAPTLNRAQVARLQGAPSIPLALYERTVSTVRLPDGRLQLMSQ